MIKRMKGLLQDFSHWKILVKEDISSQLFYIGKELDISREVNTVEAEVTLYIDTPGDKQRGMASSIFHPTQSDEEILSRLKDLEKEALSVPNPWFPLVSPGGDGTLLQENSVYQRHNLVHWTSSLAEAVFKADKRENSWVNSLEVFLTEKRRSFANSQGVEFQHNGYSGMLDLVVTAKNEESREAELHREYRFSAYEPEEVTALVESQLKYCEDRVRAEKLKILEEIDVILRYDALVDFFAYWQSATHCESIYKKIHPNPIGKDLWSGQGDKLGMTALPRLYNAYSCPFDGDGQLLQEKDILNDGTVQNLHGGKQFSYYMDVDSSGEFPCYSVNPGSLNMDALYRGSYLEIISFSDFQMDRVSGDFGGEIRLAYWFDGTKSHPVTGGSVTGSIGRSAPWMTMSDKLERQGNWLCPQALRLKYVQITPAV